MQTTTSILSNKILFFDVDDTLIKTQDFYDQTNFNCAVLIKSFNQTELEMETILKKKTEIDLKNMKILGFSPERFPTTWKETYRYFVSEHCELEESVVEEQAKKVFTAVVPLIDNVESVLRQVKSIAKEMRMFTAGDVVIQRKRIQDSGLAFLFDDFHIVPLKTPDVMKEIISSPSESVMIGNSLKSDIMPALANNVKAIHIERKTWAYDAQEINESDENYIRLERFDDLMTI